jgi:hypothetical protein
MMNKTGWIVALLIGLVLGAVGGWSAATFRAENSARNILSSMATSEIVNAEIRAARAYLTGSPESAYNALNELLHTYGRYADWPEQIPGERAERSAFASAITHGRLANVCARLGRTEESQTHMDEALKHPTIGDEKKLVEMVGYVDRAEEKQWNFKKE